MEISSSDSGSEEEEIAPLAMNELEFQEWKTKVEQIVHESAFSTLKISPPSSALTCL